MKYQWNFNRTDADQPFCSVTITIECPCGNDDRLWVHQDLDDPDRNKPDVPTVQCEDCDREIRYIQYATAGQNTRYVTTVDGFFLIYVGDGIPKSMPTAPNQGWVGNVIDGSDTFESRLEMFRADNPTLRVLSLDPSDF